MAKLILRREDGTEQEFPIEESGSLTIGRQPDCGIPIDDVQASRRHCSVVRLQSGAFEVADLGSTNGTVVNSTLVKRKKLRHGDVIRIGAVEIVFHDPGATDTSGSEIENCFLVHAKGERKGEKVELTHQRTTIGRKESNTILLEDANASSYHCEIVRDLNGYTIRDLGSTNGTLVNNEMITEAQLSHGARIRIGSTRFVFQDPALAEIDLELAGVDDDEAEWGMMRELDLAAVRRRHPATIVYLVLFLAVLGGLYYVMTMERRQGPTGPQAPKGNLLAEYSFESVASAYAWDSDVPGEAETQTTTSVKGQGDSSLELRTDLDRAVVFYGDLLPGSARRYDLQASLAARGGATARIGLLWSGHRLSRWDLSEEVGSSGLSTVKLATSSPPWANTVRLGVLLTGPGTAYLDDISLVPTGAAAASVLEQNDFRVILTEGQHVDVAHLNAPILANGRLIARDGSGAELDASGLRVRSEVQGEDFVLVTIEGVGDAAVVGLELEEARGYLTSRGGFRAFGFQSLDSRETWFRASFPAGERDTLSLARKLLLGDRGRAIAVLPAQDDGQLECETRDEAGKRTCLVLGAPVDGIFAIRFKTDLRGEAVEAGRRMSQALLIFGQKRWGDYLDEAPRALAEFPFASKPMRRELEDHIGEIGKEWLQLGKEADELVRDYQEFRDLQSLDRVRDILGIWKEKFQVTPGEGLWGERYAALAKTEAEERAAAERERQSMVAGWALEQALYIHIPEDETYSAAVLLSYIDTFLPASTEATQAREELARIQEKNPKVLEVLEKLGLRGK